MAVETEKKFLLHHLPHDLMNKGKAIYQGYITKSKHHTVRIRISDDDGFVTIKGPTVNAARKEFEYAVPVSDAREMLARFCPGPIIEKTRYTIGFKGFEWEIDVFKGRNKGLVVAEIELESADQPFEKPDWVGLEITHDTRYYNSNLVDHPFTQWANTPGA